MPWRWTSGSRAPSIGERRRTRCGGMRCGAIAIAPTPSPHLSIPLCAPFSTLIRTSQYPFSHPFSAPVSASSVFFLARAIPCADLPSPRVPRCVSARPARTPPHAMRLVVRRRHGSDKHNNETAAAAHRGSRSTHTGCATARARNQPLQHGTTNASCAVAARLALLQRVLLQRGVRCCSAPRAHAWGSPSTHMG